ncbi:MAG: glutamyl-tRNA synthetase [Thermoleophilia bacterium]|nr:glutamyl-tRNA synthetase [Thermoleophilia bacterium]
MTEFANTAQRSVRVRFAPSPTGTLHLGSALVALANAAFARAHDGALVLRIDDTDRVRSTDDHALDVLRLLRWLDIDWDEGPLYQHQRAELHARALDQLTEHGAAYPCFCTEERLADVRARQIASGEPPRYDGRCRHLDRSQAAKSVAAGTPHVLRFALPDDRDVVIDDLVRGPITIPRGASGDPVLRRADGTVGYLLSSVVDDLDLGITHILRGEDHLTNTARQIMLFEAFGATRDTLPQFAHLPLLRDVSGAKLSKRSPLGTLDELVDAGFLPVTVRRYLAELLGQDAVDLLAPASPPFDLERVGTGAPRVDSTRLYSLGRDDFSRLPLADLLADCSVDITRVAEPAVREIAASSATRLEFRAELHALFDGPGANEIAMMLAAAADHDEQQTANMNQALDIAVRLLRTTEDSSLSDDWARQLVSEYRSQGKAAGYSVRQLLHPLRLALTGAERGPGLDLIVAAIGATDALGRVQRARVALEGMHRGGGEPDRG